MRIFITEYMYSGVSGEFIEFTNLGTEAIDMTGWSYDDDSQTPGTVSLSEFSIVQPGESVILTEAEATAFRTSWGLPASLKVIGGLTANLGRNDEINLYDNTNNLVDRLTYGDQNFPGTIRTQNISGWTEAVNLGINDISQWLLSSLGDVQSSVTSTGTDVGNPGIYTLDGGTVTAGVTITPTDGGTNIVESGLTDSYTVVLDSQPGADVTITIDGGTQTTTNPTTLTFTAENWNVPQSVTITAVEDGVAEGNHTGTIGHTASSTDADYNGIAIADLTVNITEAGFLTKIGGYRSSNGAEIPAFDPLSNRLFVVAGPVVEVLNFANPANLSKIGDLPLDTTSVPDGFTLVPNSVAVGKVGTVSGGLVAVAVAITNQDTLDDELGEVQFFRAADGVYLGKVTVGFLPDMLTFTPDGTKILTANEGQPNDAYTNDPVGSVSVVTLTGVDLVGGSITATVEEASFESFNSQIDALRAAGVRITGPGSTVAQDLEPEYIAFSDDGTKAWVTLQENNAIAVVDIATATVESILPLGLKDHNSNGNGLDASDRDGVINIQNWPVFGMYQPDSIASYTAGGQTYYITANEGDARDYDGFSEEERLSDLNLDSMAFPDAATLQLDENLGRLTVTNATGDVDGDGDFEQIHAFGSRSFSIWDSNGSLVYDSGNDFEEITAAALPAYFNASNSNNTFDNRSDDKGPEPEGVAVGTIGDRTYAFIGLERIGGVMVYDVTAPHAPEFVEYLNTRDFSASVAGDSGPEGLTFIPQEDSPNGQPLLVVANEVSNTVAVYNIAPVVTPAPFTLQILHTSDQEAGVPAFQDIPGLSAVMNALDGKYANTLKLTSGDLFIAGPFFDASRSIYDDATTGNPANQPGIADILIQNELGWDVASVGNHEFDAGDATFFSLLAPQANWVNGEEGGVGIGAGGYPGALFPYLAIRNKLR